MLSLGWWWETPTKRLYSRRTTTMMTTICGINSPWNWTMDLADQIDDYICSFEGLGDLTMDSLAIFIFLWAVLALFSVWLIKLLYNKYLNKDKSSSAANSRQTSVAPTSGSPSSVAGKTEKRLSEPRDLLATKSKVEDLSKPLTGGSGGRGRSSASPLNSAGQLPAVHVAGWCDRAPLDQRTARSAMSHRHRMSWVQKRWVNTYISIQI